MVAVEVPESRILSIQHGQGTINQVGAHCIRLIRRGLAVCTADQTMPCLRRFMQLGLKTVQPLAIVRLNAGTRSHKVTGNPDEDHISTSYAERMNLQIRMNMRRFTRLTNAHSKKVENHRHALSLYFMYYNFARIHSTLRVTPAMQAGVAGHVWTLEEIVQLLENA